MLARTSLRDRFIAWLETKSADEEYIWDDPYRCACGQFSLEMGEDRWLGKGWGFLNALAKEHPRTFGALLGRARGSSA